MQRAGLFVFGRMQLQRPFHPTTADWPHLPACRSVRRGTPLSAATLARKYGASEAVLEQVLQYNAVPLVHADEGQLVGSWPAPGAGGSSEGGDKQEKSS